MRILDAFFRFHCFIEYLLFRAITPYIKDGDKQMEMELRTLSMFELFQSGMLGLPRELKRRALMQTAFQIGIIILVVIL